MHDGFRFDARMETSTGEGANRNAPLPEDIAATIIAATENVMRSAGERSELATVAPGRSSNDENECCSGDVTPAIEQIPVQRAAEARERAPSTSSISADDDRQTDPSPKRDCQLDAADELPCIQDNEGPEGSDVLVLTTSYLTAADEGDAVKRLGEPAEVAPTLGMADRQSDGEEPQADANSPRVDPFTTQGLTNEVEKPSDPEERADMSDAGAPASEAMPSRAEEPGHIDRDGSSSEKAQLGPEPANEQGAAASAPEFERVESPLPSQSAGPGAGGDFQSKENEVANEVQSCPPLVSTPASQADSGPLQHSATQPSAAESRDPVSMIRDLIETHATSDPDASPDADQHTKERKDPVVAPSTPHKDERLDRWAKLREALIETELDGEDEDIDRVQNGTTPSASAPNPLANVQARHAAKIEEKPGNEELPTPAASAEQVEVLYDETVLGPSGPLERETKALLLETPAPLDTSLDKITGGIADNAPDKGIRTWDSPADHQMSKRGRLMWKLAVYGPVVAVPVCIILLSPFPPKAAIQHYVAAMGCTAASYAGVAPAEEGKPGYHARLDHNGNGVACEPEVQRTLSGNGAVSFIRVGDY